MGMQGGARQIFVTNVCFPTPRSSEMLIFSSCPTKSAGKTSRISSAKLEM